MATAVAQVAAVARVLSLTWELLHGMAKKKKKNLSPRPHHLNGH